MSFGEGFPTGAEQDAAAKEAGFFADGSLNEAFLNDKFGIGIEEASQEVEFGTHTGSVASMLDDDKCPVGGILSAAYAEEGIEGVVGKLDTLSQLDPKFSLKVTDTTIERELKKK